MVPRPGPPYKVVGLVTIVLMGLIGWAMYAQLRRDFTPKTKLTMVAPRAGLVMYPGALGDNGYALGAHSAGVIAGPPNPYIYPENLPRTNARGGPGGKPGCWQTITRQLWPAPMLVMDTGASLAPYNHFDVGSPLVVDYVWGRQLGDNTINP